MKHILLLLITFASLMASAQVNQIVKINQEAGYPGGDQALVQKVYQTIKWPEATKGKTIIDETIISLDVLPDSTATNVITLKPVGYGIDDLLVKIISNSKFIPSIQNGTAVKMNIMFNIPIQVRN